SAPERCKVGWMLVRMAGGEGVHGGGRRIVAKDFGHDIHEHALAVTARAIDEHQRMFADAAGQAVAAPLLQEADQLRVASRGLVKELEPSWTTRVERRNRCEFGNAVLLLALAQQAGAEINRPARRSQQPRVTIPIVDGDGDLRIALGEAINAGGERGFVGDVPFTLVLILGELSNEFTRPLEDDGGLILGPVNAIPVKPCAGRMTE